MPIRSAVPAIVALLWLALPAAAFADCQPAGPLEEALLRAPVAFVGTVVATNGPAAMLEVVEVWAGDVAARVEVRGLSDGAAFGEDDRTWRAGARYLVVPIVVEGRLRDHICTATTEWRDELAELRPDDAHPPQAVAGSAAAGPPTAWLLVAAMGVLAIGASFVFLRRR